MKKIMILLLSFAMLFLVSCKNSGATDESTPNGMLKAGNEAVDYYFYYPEDWETDSNDGMVSIRYSTSENVKQETYATISVTSFTNKDSEQVVNAYWSEYKDKIAAYYDGFEIKNESETSLDNVVAAKKVYKGGLDGTTYKFAQVICIRNSIVYLITFTGTEADYEELIDDFDAVVANFHFI